MKITIIGHGYVGLVSASVFADLGNEVWVIGRDQAKIDKLKKGEILFFEPGLKEVVQRNLKAKRLKFTLSYKEAISNSQIAFICVGTPPGEGGAADLSNVFSVARQIGKNIKDYILIVCKSTVPVGTNKKIQKLLVEELKINSKRFDIASCPEFLKEGTALSDTLNPDRIVIGVEAKKAEEYLLTLHKPINGARVLTNIESAEMIKYASNAFLATKISFANALSFLCEKTGADIEKVMDGVGIDKRIGRNFLYPGVGYGGSCFPKDVKALIKTAENYGENLQILKEVEKINVEAIERFVAKVKIMLNGSFSGKTLGILGLSFKPNTDDIREAPSLKIIDEIQKIDKKVKIKVFDPVAMKNVSKIAKNVIYCQNSYDTAKEADLLIIVTEWNEFRQLNLERIKKLMRRPVILDGRNIYDPKTMLKIGFDYKSIGRN